MTRRSRLSRLLRREGGQGIVELGFVLPLFLVLVIGVVEVADSMNGYVTVIDAARDGARLGSKNLASDAEIRNLVAVETDRLRDTVDTANDVTITRIQVDGEDAIRVEVCNDRSLILSVPVVMPDGFRMCSTTTMPVLG